MVTSRKALYPLALLCTGTTIAIVTQLASNLRAVHPSTQLFAWTKYAVATVLYLVVRLFSSQSKPKGHLPSSQRLLMQTLLGILDVFAYSLYSIGFLHCGSALSTVLFSGCQQVFTALTRRVVLKRSMPMAQYLAVAIIVAGLAIRPLEHLRPTPSGGGLRSLLELVSSTDGEMLFALGCIIASGFFYSLLGVAYERYTVMEGPGVDLNAVSLTMSLVGLTSMTLYQTLFVLPHADALILEPFKNSHQPLSKVLLAFGVFGGLFALHQGYVQGRVFQHQGAMTVGIVNAVRASAVAIASSILFCSTAPHQCLTLYTGTSAAVVSAGAAMYAIAGAMAKAKETEKKKA